MYHKTLKTPSFHALFVYIDDKLADKTRSEGCPGCGGPLYQADYPRSPLGLPVSCREYYDSRHSLCCGDCRKRVTTSLSSGKTLFWKHAKAHLPLTALAGLFPRQLILIYPGRLNEQLEKALQFLALLTAGVYRAV